MNINQQRLADQIRDIVAECFTGGRLRDPRLEGVAITAVKLSQNYHHASIYYLNRGKGTDEQTQKGLGAVKGHLRTQLAKRLDTRRVPALNFHYDESVDTGSYIEGLLAQLNQ